MVVVQSGNIKLDAGNLWRLADQRMSKQPQPTSPWILCCCSNSKLDYILCYESALIAGVPFCPLPAHLGAQAAQKLASDFPFSSLLFIDGEFIAIQGKPRPNWDWVERSSLVFLTSGSTGGRKLVFSTIHNVAAANGSILRRLHYGTDDIVLNYLPMSFDYGFYQYLLCKEAGASLVLVDEGFGLQTTRLIDELAATILPVVPTLLAGIQPLLGTRVFGNTLRAMTSTGEALSDGLLERTQRELPSLKVFSMYGLTECKRVSILTPDDRPQGKGSVGRPLDCCNVHIDQPNQEGVGEIVVLGSNVALGTYAYEKQDDSALVPFEGVLRTGDFGRLDRDGFLYVEGRRDSLLKVMGNRISAREIEDTLLLVDQVISVRVRAVQDGVEALCVVNRGCTAANLRSVLVESIGAFASRIEISLVDKLPVSDNYKIVQAESDR